MLRAKQVTLGFSYLAALLAVAPVFLYLDRPVQLATVLAMVGGGIGDRRDRVLLGALPATLLAGLLFLVYLLQFSLANPILPVVNLLVLLLALRLLGDKPPRNILQIFVLSLFTLAAASLLTLSMAYLIYLLLLSVVLTVGLVLLSYLSADPELLFKRGELKSILSWSLLLPAGSLLLMVGFFAIMPRTNYPLWNFLNPAPVARTGFSEQVRPGSFAALAADSTIAFRVEMDPLPGDQLYWRGTVLNRISEAIWERRPPIPDDNLTAPDAPPVNQLLFLEPRQDRYLPALDVSSELSGYWHQRQEDYVYTAHRALQKRTRYQAAAGPGRQLRLARSAAATSYLQRPEHISERLLEVAEQVRSRGNSRSERIALLETFFSERQLTYASSGLQPSTTPVDDFLFESRRGYCEYFASAFGLLARLSEIPARLVGGYLGGDYHPVGGYYLVSEEMAHVWVEVLDDTDTWRRIDPSRLAVNAETGLLGLRQRQRPWLTGLLDSLDHAWNRTVINYDLQRQFEVLNAARRSLQGLYRSPGEFKPLITPIIGLLLVVGIGYGLLRYRRANPARNLAERFLDLVKTRAKTPLPPSCGLNEAAHLMQHPLADRFAAIYGGAIYRDRVLDKAELDELRRLLTELERVGKKKSDSV